MEAIADVRFSFTLTLKDENDEPLNGIFATKNQSGAIGTISVIDGKASFGLKHGQSITILALPDNTVYNLKEAEDEAYEMECKKLNGTLDSEIKVEVVNRLIEMPETTSVTVRKVWNDGDGSNRPSNIRIRISNQDGVVGVLILNRANNWEDTLAELPVQSADGITYIYTVTELNVPSGYRVSYRYVDGVMIVTNTNDEYIDDHRLVLGGGININEGDCFD